MYSAKPVSFPGSFPLRRYGKPGKKSREAFIISFPTILKDALTDCTGIDEKQNEISREMEIVAGMIETCVRENAATAQDQGQYRRRYDNLIAHFETLQTKQAALQKERAERERKADVLSKFLFELTELNELDVEFSPQRWNAIVDHVTVHHDGILVFSFQNGGEVMAEV